jgi:hypothetical protein
MIEIIIDTLENHPQLRKQS